MANSVRHLLVELDLVGYAEALSADLVPRRVAPIFCVRQRPDKVLFPPYRFAGTEVIGVLVTDSDLSAAVLREQATRLSRPVPARAGHTLWIDRSMTPHYEPTQVAMLHLARATQINLDRAKKALQAGHLERALDNAQAAISADESCIEALLTKALVHSLRGEEESVAALLGIVKTLAPELEPQAALFGFRAALAPLQESRQDLQVGSVDRYRSRLPWPPTAGGRIGEWIGIASWFTQRGERAGSRGALLVVAGSILLMLGWCAVSYIPFLWHPYVKIEDSGDSSLVQPGMRMRPAELAAENSRLLAEGKVPAWGQPVNPIFFPAPHEVATALYTSLSSVPRPPGDPGLFASLWQSSRIIIFGFTLAVVLGVAFGILCGAFSFLSRLIEPLIFLVRYLPLPLISVLFIAALSGLNAPALAVVFLAVFFPMLEVTMDAVRWLDPSWAQVAQTLGAGRREILRHVVVPGILPVIYRNLRWLLWWAWLSLLVAEQVRAQSGITRFVRIQAEGEQYANVFAAIIVVGAIMFLVDRLLAFSEGILFPWESAYLGDWHFRRTRMILRFLGLRRAAGRISPPAATQDRTPAKVTID